MNMCDFFIFGVFQMLFTEIVLNVIKAGLKPVFTDLFLFYLFKQYFKMVVHLAVQLFYLAALCANIFTYIQTLYLYMRIKTS